MTGKKPQSDFEKFDKVMGGLLSVPYQELQEELEKDRKKKSRKKRVKRELSETFPQEKPASD
jgi:inner membrane protein involved in colicin E2 resistance